MKDAGTDSQVFVKLYGTDGASTETPLDKKSERFERARSDTIKVCHGIIFIGVEVDIAI